MPGMKEQLTLIAVTRSDDVYQAESKTERTVFAERLPLYAGEFRTAAASGYDLQHAMKIHAFEYEGETAARYSDQEYEIYRTHLKNDDWIELYLSTREKA